MPICLYCNKHVNEGSRGTKKVHGDRAVEGTCAYSYMIEQNYKRQKRTAPKARAKRTAELVEKGYVNRDNFNDSFGV